MITSLLRRTTLPIVVLCFCLGATPGNGVEFPPVKPANPPPFEIPAVGRTLDEPWMFVDTLFDAARDRPDLFGAFPTGLEFTHGGRGFLGVLHTVFHTADAGETWDNLDRLPPPANSAWGLVRSPRFIGGIAVRPTANTAVSADSIFLATMNGDSTNGYVWVVRSITGSYILWQQPFLSIDAWLTQVAAPSHGVALAFAGLDGDIFRYDSVEVITDTLINDTLYTDTTLVLQWDTVDYAFPGTWIDEVEYTPDSSGAGRRDERVIAVGSNQIKSEDLGLNWESGPPADPGGDRAFDFAPDGMHGLAGGGSSATSSGWVRFTADSGRTWSERTLQVLTPILGVHMVTEEIGYAVGGNVNQAVGRIYRTNDGGENWDLELAVDAELREVASVRANAAYVNVVAAGVFPDFSGGVWLSRLFMPQSSGAVLVTNPDTLDFGDVDPGLVGTLDLRITNIGNEAVFVTNVVTSDGVFDPLWIGQAIELMPDSSILFDVVFSPDSAAQYDGELTILNGDGDDVRVYCRGTSGASPAERGHAGIPGTISLSVWPNPGNAIFSIGYEIPAARPVNLRVYDLTGRLVETLTEESVAAGSHRIEWNAAGQASGLYFVRLETDDGIFITRKLMLIR